MKMRMKMFCLFVALAFVCCFSITAFANGELPRLVDNADLLSLDEETTLLAKLDDVSEKYQVDFVIVTVETVGMMTSDDYVEDVYDSTGYGYGENKDGVILLVAMEEREYRILSNGLAADAISLSDIDTIGYQFESYLTNEQYVEGFNIFIDECEYEVNGEINGFPFAFGKNLLISLAVGLVLALTITGVWKGKLKTVRQQRNAANYVKNGSMNIVVANDFFLYSTVTRHAKPENNNRSSGSGGGSSRNIGGGSF